jgi:hypothetical protein
MTWIPKESLIGKRVRIRDDIPIMSGIFTRGHEFTVMRKCWFGGYTLYDEDGRGLVHISSNDFYCVSDGYSGIINA